MENNQFKQLEPKITTKRGRKPKPHLELLPPNEVTEPIWLSVSEAAKLAGVGSKTIRRAIEANTIKFKVINNRYLISLAPLINHAFKSTKLRNKLTSHGLGQYVDKWK
jgi:excisionase family DNA binding protein